MMTRHWTNQLAWCVVLLGLAQHVHGQSKGETDWPAYGNDPGGMRYSPLRQIDAPNVGEAACGMDVSSRDVSDGSNG